MTSLIVNGAKGILYKLGVVKLHGNLRFAKHQSGVCLLLLLNLDEDHG